VVAPKAIPGAENAGKPGYYTVKPGDTLIRVGLDTGQNWRDVARWNGLDNPNIIEVGQVLRVIPPGTTDSAVARPVAPSTTVAGTALPPASATRPASATASSPAAPPVVAPLPTVASTNGTSTSNAPAPVATAPLPPASSAGDDDIAWIWPSSGTVLAGFDEAKNKGLDIAGKLGDPVLAAGDGRVVYAGSGLRGYGNLVILKHNNTFLTAYAHNQTLLVKEDQTVRKGQKIAEIGQSDTDRAKLHFEIRRQGKPVDPARYLPAR
jgi:lipoprotein NlpD